MVPIIGTGRRLVLQAASPVRLGLQRNPWQASLRTYASKSEGESELSSPSLLKKTFYTIGGALLAGYTYDSILGEGIVNRVVRSLWTFGIISIDYKRNFDEDHDIAALHERNAQRLYDLVTTNKGMYIKMGQMIAIQGFMFPRQYQDKFKLMFDRAPEEPWSMCDETLKNELGENYRTEVFSYLEEEPIASASIAQVHRGVLKKTGQKVAVKIQKQSITKQVDADLMTYKFAMKMYEAIFGMPLGVVSDYVAEKCREELDFVREMSNANRMSELIENDPDFKGKVYIPKYYPDYSTDKVMCLEWIEGDSIGLYMKLKDKGYNIKSLMDSIVQVYSRQVFTWGVVHCDLHPGNLIVRNLPNGRQQLVILDHGLYEMFSDEFKKQYSEFWKYTMERDKDKVIGVLQGWGMNPDDMMLSAAGLTDNSEEKVKHHREMMKNMSYYERQQMVKSRMKQFLENSDKFPMCLAFVMRSMRIVQGLNRNFGSPVNRLNVLVSEANKTVQRYDQTTAILSGTFNWNDYSLSIKRGVTYWLMKIYTTVTFEFNRIQKYLATVFNKQPVTDLEDVYERQLVESGEDMGFDEIPSTNDVMVEASS